MVLLRLISFTFMLLFTLLEARNSLHNKPPHHQGILEAKFGLQSGNMEAKDIHRTILAKGIKPAVVQVEEEGTKMRLNGRKLATEGDSKKEKAKSKSKSKTKMSVNGRSSSSKISGRNNNNNASGIQTSEAKPEDSKGKGRTGEMTWLRHDKKPKGKNKNKEAPNKSFQMLESHDLSEADNEVWTLLHQEYPGDGGGRRKPPSHNR